MVSVWLRSVAVLCFAHMTACQLFTDEAEWNESGIGSVTLFVVWVSLFVLALCCLGSATLISRWKELSDRVACAVASFVSIIALASLGWFVAWFVEMVPVWEDAGNIFSDKDRHSTWLFFAWIFVGLFLCPCRCVLSSYEYRPSFSFRQFPCSCKCMALVYCVYILGCASFLLFFLWWGICMLPVWKGNGLAGYVVGIVFLSVVVGTPLCRMGYVACCHCRAHYVKLRNARALARCKRRAIPCRDASDLTEELRKHAVLTIIAGATDAASTACKADDTSQEVILQEGESVQDWTFPGEAHLQAVPPFSKLCLGEESVSDALAKLEEGRVVSLTGLAGEGAEEPLKLLQSGPPLQDGKPLTPVLVHVEPPSIAARLPVDICVVLDISGSMSREAEVQDEKGQKQAYGLSLLDIAKHGVKTLTHTLDSQDRMAVIAFNTYAVEAISLTLMDELGKAQVDEAVSNLCAGGGTDIWQGLFSGLEVMRNGSSADAARFRHLIFLTDGLSERRNSIVPQMLEYHNRYERLPCTINTFGFGYDIDSQLLLDMASNGNGAFAFIPDAGFVGTAFVNALSTLLGTMACDVYVNVEPEEGASIVEVMGHLKAQKNGDGLRISLGTLQYGQSRDIVLKMSIPSRDSSFLVASLQYELATQEKIVTDCIESTALSTKQPTQIVEAQCHRCNFVDVLHSKCLPLASMFTLENDALGSLTALAESIATSSSKAQPNVKALVQDITGQASEAVSSADFFQRWGRHYLPSLMFAHQLQRCNNFKDPGVQVYGGDMFKRSRDLADAIFNTLPAPERSRGNDTRCGAPVSMAPVSMAAYNNCYGGCIDGSSLIKLANGSSKRVMDLTRGDQVWGLPASSGAPQTNLITCVVRSSCPEGRCPMVELSSGLRLTPYHPVCVSGAWHFPKDLAPVRMAPCEAVYSFVLQDNPAIVIDGIACISLGHGLHDEVARHPYYGTDQVLDDLSKMVGFEDGLVSLDVSSILRDPETGLVCSMVPK